MARKLDRQYLLPVLAVGFGIALVGAGRSGGAACPCGNPLCNPVDEVGPFSDDAALDDPPEARTAGLTRTGASIHAGTPVALASTPPLPLAWASNPLDRAPKQSPPL